MHVQKKRKVGRPIGGEKHSALREYWRIAKRKQRQKKREEANV